MHQMNTRLRSHPKSEGGVEVDEIIAGLIAQYGYHTSICELVRSLNILAEISLADPSNAFKRREFWMWASAVRAAIHRHSIGFTFDRRPGVWDEIRAHGLGVSLDC